MKVGHFMRTQRALWFMVVVWCFGLYGAHETPAMPDDFRNLSVVDKKTQVLSLFEKQETLDEALTHLVWLVDVFTVMGNAVDEGCALFDASLTHFEKHINALIVGKKVAQAQKKLKIYTDAYEAFIAKVRENKTEYLKVVEWGNKATAEVPCFDVRFKALQKAVDVAVESAVGDFTQNLTLRISQLEASRAALEKEKYDLTIQLREKGNSGGEGVHSNQPPSPSIVNKASAKSLIDVPAAPSSPRVVVLQATAVPIASSSVSVVEKTSVPSFSPVPSVTLPDQTSMLAQIQQLKRELEQTKTRLMQERVNDLNDIALKLGAFDVQMQGLMVPIPGLVAGVGVGLGVTGPQGKLGVLKTSLATLKDKLGKLKTALSQLKLIKKDKK